MSSPPLRVFLKKEEDRTLWELCKATEIPQKVKERAQVLRLSSQGWKVKKIAEYSKCSTVTVSRIIHRWFEKGLGGLWDREKPGRKKKWSCEDIQVIENRMLTEPRSYSSQQLCQILATERKVELSQRQLRRILKKKTTSGKERESV